MFCCSRTIFSPQPAFSRFRGSLLGYVLKYGQRKSPALHQQPASLRFDLFRAAQSTLGSLIRNSVHEPVASVAIVPPLNPAGSPSLFRRASERRRSAPRPIVQPVFVFHLRSTFLYQTPSVNITCWIQSRSLYRQHLDLQGGPLSRHNGLLLLYNASSVLHSVWALNASATEHADRELQGRSSFSMSLPSIVSSETSY